MKLRLFFVRVLPLCTLFLDRRWAPSGHGKVKPNVDVAQAPTGWTNGVVLCDLEAIVLFAASSKCCVDLGVDHEEVMTVKSDMELALEHGFLTIFVESNSTRVTRAINAVEAHNSYLASVV